MTPICELPGDSPKPTPAEIIGVTEEKYNAMVAYAKLLRRKHPGMKSDRIRRKVADKYHIKIEK